FAEKIGKNKTHISGYIGNTGGRKAKNLLPELITMGVNGLWFLTGEGPMFIEDLIKREPVKTDYEQTLAEEARKIQAMFDRGMIKIDRGEKDAESNPKSLKEGHQELAITIPVFAHAIAAGKPVTCSGTIEEYITISANRVKHPKDTYAVKAFGDSMKDAGILEGDLLIVDRAIEPMNNHIVIASINDEQTVKRLKIKKGAVSLLPENTSYKPIEITGEMDFRTLGVVTYVVRKTA
ncbi:MAG: translesion error-prone DNA polymerase V autoproteolytic subunit, partial [Syntrophaceae bacterium]|nr:translesion error-prone DNA polymerase V autoproteolytic subunit [Syntrophaceae bacterium]